MKKIILAAAIVCAATFVHAASVAWSMTSVEKSAATDLAADAMIGYFMDGSTYETFSALTTDKVAAFVVANSLSSGSLKVSRGVGSVGNTFGSYDPGSNVSGYIVIFDNADATKAEYFASTAMDTKQVPGSGNLQFSKMFSQTSGWTSLASTPTPPGPTPDVPEPTSGLLLVLGGAALALRRRR